jgi:uncharacterized beta-barrel protein YwiB (DUF1934 family)
MKIPVMLSICGRQNYIDQEPEVVELVTDGTLENKGNGWEICYKESDLTGMEGVSTSFLVESEKITLTRTGNLTSQMVFKVGIPHESLYNMGFGVLMITVNATKIRHELSAEGGWVDLSYGISIEQSAAGNIDYRLEIKTK